jgi:hypothetical protein
MLKLTDLRKLITDQNYIQKRVECRLNLYTDFKFINKFSSIPLFEIVDNQMTASLV